MHLREGEFSRAHTDFFEAFKNYDESGSPRWELIPLTHSLLFLFLCIILCLLISFCYPRRLACLKYLVLANMLMKSGINPFDSQEVGNTADNSGV